MVEGALDTSEDVDPNAQIEQAETALYQVAEEGAAKARSRPSPKRPGCAVEMAEKALNSGGGLSGLTTGLETLNAKTAAFTIRT